MFGLAVLVVFGIYLLISILLVRWAMRAARKQGRRAWVWGLVTAFVMYNLVFWDWMPTVVTHQYYCSTEAGFWTYKTVDQWKKENPGVMETLVANKVSIQRVGDDSNHTDTQILNQRFHWLTEKHHITLFLPIYRWKSELVDKDNGGSLAS